MVGGLAGPDQFGLISSPSLYDGSQDPAWESARSRLLVMECRKGDGGGGGKASVLQWALPSPV